MFPLQPADLPRSLPRAAGALLVCAITTGSIGNAGAQAIPPADTHEIARQIAVLRAEQARIDELQRRTEAGIRALEARLGLQGTPSPSPSAANPAPEAPKTSRLTVSGDLRLRVQGDYSDDNGGNRHSSQARARLGATYAVNDRLTVGARIVSGDADDPNSTDVQLSNWDDDFQVGIDLAYAQLDFGDLKLFGGKIPQPFVRTDLVWDGDVAPQGLAAAYRAPLATGGTFRANGLLFAIDEQAAGPDSYMGGAQFGYDSPAHGGFKFDFSSGYYRYRLGSLAGADAGDWRSNRRRPDGGYLSGYELIDIIAGASWQSAKEKWPLRLVGDYVKNLGAVDEEDTGYGLDLSLGRASRPGDWRFAYGYARTDVDAVLAAFSNDNIGIATNYRLHALTVDYTPMPKTMLSAIWYHYKPDDPHYAGGNEADDWLDRFRLFFLVNF